MPNKFGLFAYILRIIFGSFTLKVAANSGHNLEFDFLQECWNDPALVIAIKKLLMKYPQWGIVIRYLA
ncbi:hypothetical protein GNF10_30305 [Nostoc sp. UCD121]|uniref:hypothetical protein n=1 Tax=unclassified Nostoc TaxID=2593658 RepID=UPI001628C8C0|nr:MULTISPECIES: hypothetical protein [unclassified Nostoc]MBC1224847.1 hypothetical protein [Nostoc sp. UCD120]MBC1280125.1 hypothetical protein [Nostoc sp. UCD121]MBC1299419.1 hypothetical protein [Nostoc sp. UCD122]